MYTRISDDERVKKLFHDAYIAEEAHARILTQVLEDVKCTLEQHEHGTPLLHEKPVVGANLKLKHTLEDRITNASQASLEDAFTSMAEIERDEYTDDILTYLVEGLTTNPETIKMARSLMQDHQDEYMTFFNDFEGGKYKRRFETIKPIKKKKILIVDDLEPNRTLLSAILERKYDIQTASDGDEALKRLQQGEKYDLVFTDIEMERMNGDVLYHESEKLPHKTKFVFHTGNASKYQRFLKEHDLPTLEKPSTPPEIIGIIDAHVKKYRKDRLQGKPL